MRRTSSSKQSTMLEFVERLRRSKVKDRILKVVQHGSTVRGNWQKESDIDLLIVAAGSLYVMRNA